MAAPKPIFYVVLRDGKHWLVEAEWPDGTIETYQCFQSLFRCCDLGKLAI